MTRSRRGGSWAYDAFTLFPDNRSSYSPQIRSGGFGHRLMLEDRTFRTIRGGSWNYYPWSLRSTRRDLYTPSYRNYYIGFRLMLEGAP